MPALIEYKCPACGGALQFDTALQKLKCPYCDSVYDLAEMEKKDEALNETPPAAESAWDVDVGGAWGEGEADDLAVYTCQSCGGQIVGDKNMAACTCPYCSNPVVMSGQFSGELRPELVIPFKKSKEEAIAAVNSFVKKRRFVSRAFKDQRHLQEIKGIYVPFWLYDAEVNAGAIFHASTVRSWSDRKYRYTETKHYKLYRRGTLTFRDLPVDGSGKIADDMMESIEPFDAGDAVDFRTAYLAGYLADRYDRSAEDCIPRARERMQASAEAALRNTTAGYMVSGMEYSDLDVRSARAAYALCPVWLLDTEYNGTHYYFAMNGQTGKVVGDMPADKSLIRSAILRNSLLYSAVLAVAAQLLYYFM